MGGRGECGPGLGQQEWGKQALQRPRIYAKPMLWDADALNLLPGNNKPG